MAITLPMQSDPVPRRDGEEALPPRRLPRAIVVSGPPASGKTTLARGLAQAAGYALVDLDTVTGPLTAAALELAGTGAGDLESAAARHLRAARYETILEVASANLEAGIGVVLAAPFTSERASRTGWAAVATRLGGDRGAASVGLLYLRVPPELLRSRMSARDSLRDRAKLRGGPEAPGAETLVPDAIVLDGTASVEAQLAAALATLAAPAPGNRHQTAC